MSIASAPNGALPARFRRLRVLVIGCGDVGSRMVRQLRPRGDRIGLLALHRCPDRAGDLRALGLRVLAGDLDHPVTLRRLSGVAQAVVHLAPPPGADAHSRADDRTRSLARALRSRSAPRRLVYVSTTGVYGDQQGRWVDETCRPEPQTARAARRVDAECTLRRWGRSSLRAPRVALLRAPGIYAPDRAGGTPRERLLRGTPVLCAADDVFTNHIHADDLARACWLALWRGRPQRSYHVNDDSTLRMGEYFDLAADWYGLPRPPRLSADQAREQLPAVQWSFMQESRRLRNGRAKRELGWRPRYPTPAQGLAAQGAPVQSKPC